PLVCVITNIGLDHVQILGDTHAKIAYEKAGIIKPGIPVLTAADEPSALEVIYQTAAEHGAPLIRVQGTGNSDEDRVQQVRDGEGTSTEPPHPRAAEHPNTEHRIEWFSTGETFTVRTAEREYTDLKMGLRGEYQRLNAACAVGGVEAMAQARGF